VAALGVAGSLADASGSQHSGGLLHRDRRATHRASTFRQDRGVAVQLGLVRGDLTGQMRLGLGEPMRTVRDPPDHRPAGLGTPAPGQGRVLPFLFGAFASPCLLSDLLRGLTDPLGAMAAVPQPRRHPLPAAVFVLARTGGGRGVFGGVQSLRFGDDLSDLCLQPFLAAVGVDRRIRGNLGAINRDRSQPRQARPGGDQQYLGEQTREGLFMVGAEPRDRRVIGDVLGAQDAEGHIRHAPTLNLP